MALDTWEATGMNQHRKRAVLYNRGLCHAEVRAQEECPCLKDPPTGCEKPRGKGDGLGMACGAAGRPRTAQTAFVRGRLEGGSSLTAPEAAPRRPRSRASLAQREKTQG